MTDEEFDREFWKVPDDVDEYLPVSRLTDEQVQELSNSWGMPPEDELVRITERQLGPRDKRYVQVPRDQELVDFPIATDVVVGLDPGVLRVSKKPWTTVPGDHDGWRRERQMTFATQVARTGAFVLCTPGFQVVQSKTIWGLLWAYFKFRVLKRPASKGPINI